MYRAKPLSQEGVLWDRALKCGFIKVSVWAGGWSYRSRMFPEVRVTLKGSATSALGPAAHLAPLLGVFSIFC